MSPNEIGQRNAAVNWASLNQGAGFPNSSHFTQRALRFVADTPPTGNSNLAETDTAGTPATTLWNRFYLDNIRMRSPISNSTTTNESIDRDIVALHDGA